MENESKWSTNGAIVMIQYFDWKSNETNSQLRIFEQKTLAGDKQVVTRTKSAPLGSVDNACQSGMLIR
jgi:hypothetical protein